MNKQLILSLSLFAGIPHTSHARISYKKIALLAGVIATGLRTAWHLKSSKQKFFDVSLALSQDLGAIIGDLGNKVKEGGVCLEATIGVLGNKVKEGGVWLEEISGKTRLNLPEFLEGSLVSDPFGPLRNEDETKNTESESSNKTEKPGYNTPVDDSKG